MNAENPIARSLLDIVLMDENHQPCLSLGTGPQILNLELRNETDHDIHVGNAHGTKLEVTFRPGAIAEGTAPTVATTGWDAAYDRDGLLPSLILTHAGGITIPAKDAVIIKLANVVPSAAGGSRSTRVEVRYTDVRMADDDTGLSGRRIVHLSLLHPHVIQGQIAGKVAENGPFRAEITTSNDVVVGGADPIPSELYINISARVPTEMTASGHGEVKDGNTRFSVQMPNMKTGENLLLRSANPAGGHGRWHRKDNTATFDLINPMVLEGHFLTLHVSIEKTYTSPGLVPLYIKYENVGGHNGQIVLLLNLTALGVPAGLGDAHMYMRGTRAIETQGNVSANSLFSQVGRLDLGHDWYLEGQRNQFWFEHKHDDNPWIQLLVNKDQFALSMKGTRRLRVDADLSARKLWLDDKWHFQHGANNDANWLNLRQKKTGNTDFYFQEMKTGDQPGFEFGTDIPGKSLNITARKNVGIKNRNPQYPLDVNGTAKANRFYVGRRMNYWWGYNDNEEWISLYNKDKRVIDYIHNSKSKLVRMYGYEQKLNISSAKHVGIRNNDPKYTLDVGGTLSAHRARFVTTAGAAIELGGGWGIYLTDNQFQIRHHKVNKFIVNNAGKYWGS